jgi:glycosyltransferase involved in cell wall biosynthesis
MLPNYWYGDAIGNTVTQFKQLLNQWGYESEIFADKVHEKLSARPYREYASEPDDSLLIYHYSTGSPVNDFALERAGNVILMYHNITPAAFFDGYDRDAAMRCKEGRELLKRFAGKTRMAMAVSPYNEAELKALGFENTSIVPCIIDYGRIKPSGAKAFGDGKTNILFVGRVAPNKRHEDLIAVYRYYKEFINSDSRLILVGGYDAVGKYYNALRNLVEVWDLDGVVFAGMVGDDELGGYFASADVFLCASRHEGFCIPLIEAMRFGVPVVALAKTGVKDTMGGAGLLLDEYDPASMAEAIGMLKEDAALREKIIAGQKERARDFDQAKLTENFRTVLMKAIGG